VNWFLSSDVPSDDLRFEGSYRDLPITVDVVLRQDHAAGEKLFVDYAEATIPIHDPRGAPERPAAIFVAVLGATNYTCAEATESVSGPAQRGSCCRLGKNPLPLPIPCELFI